MRFVRSLSDALRFRPWLLFRLFACISSGFGRFVVLWGLCCVVCGLWSVLRMLCAFTVGRFRSPSIAGSFSGLPALVGCFAALPGAAFRPLWAFILPCGFFFACGPFFVLWAFYGFGLLAAVPLLGVVVVSAFGYGLPVVFSASFWDPVRLLLFSWFYIPGAGRRSRLPFSASGLICLYNLPAFV